MTQEEHNVLDRVLAQKDAEIERLKAHIEATRTLEIFQDHQTEIREKDAEIERLNGELLDQIDRRHWLTSENESQKALIVRAADALESGQMATSTSCEVFTLITELRGAAQ